MAKNKITRRVVQKRGLLVKFILVIAWLTGFLVSLAVGFGMISGTLSVPFIPVILTLLAGYVVVILTILALILAIINEIVS